MIVTIFGATGMVGKQLLIHALAKGWTVRAFGRNVEHLIDDSLRKENLVAAKGYVFDAADVYKAIAGADGVLSAIGGAYDGTDKARSLGMKNIVAQMQKAGVKRIVALGGLGVLAGEDGAYRMDHPDYPPEYLPVGLEHKQAYLYLQDSGLDWTFVCAPDILPGEADNQYEAAAEMPGPTNRITAGNLALFMVEALEKNTFRHKRAGLGNLPNP
jgi:hypothetical protein